MSTSFSATPVKAGYGLEKSGTELNLDLKVFHCQEQVANNTDGGTATSGSWFKRALNTTIKNTIDGASLNGSNQVSLNAGSYKVRGIAVGVYCGEMRTRIYDITNSSVLLGGVNGGTENTGSGNDVANSYARVEGVITLTATTLLELQHRVSSTRTGNGRGNACNFGENEVYSELFIERIN